MTYVITPCLETNSEYIVPLGIDYQIISATINCVEIRWSNYEIAMI